MAIPYDPKIHGEVQADPRKQKLVEAAHSEAGMRGDAVELAQSVESAEISSTTDDEVYGKIVETYDPPEGFVFVEPSTYDIPSGYIEYDPDVHGIVVDGSDDDFDVGATRPSNPPVKDTVVAQLGDFVSKGESPDFGKQEDASSEYDVVFGYGKFGLPNKPLSQMSLAAAYEFGRTQIYATKGKIGRNDDLGTSAIGKYQFTRPTIRDIINQNKDLFGADFKTLAPDRSVKFDADFQEKLFLGLLRMEGLEEYKAGKITADEFQNNLASRWQSIPNTSGQYLAGKRNGLSQDEVRNLLSQLVAEKPVVEGAVADVTGMTKPKAGELFIGNDNTLYRISESGQLEEV